MPKVADPSDPLVGKALAGYQLLKRLGAGAMAAVYEARSPSGGVTVALKILTAEAANDEETVKRFDREAALAKSLDHPGLVGVIDHGTERNIHWMAMELVDGTTLESVIDSKGAMAAKDAVHIIIQIGRALEYIAGRGVIHRDVKPANILLGHKGVAKLADLGFAKDLTPKESTAGLTMAGASMGSPAYMAPEQVLDAKNATASADVYGLGASLYHALCGETPFTGRNAYDVMEKVIKEPHTPPRERNPALPLGFAAFLDWSLEKKPENRPPDAGTFVRVLEAVARTPNDPSCIPGRATPKGGKRGVMLVVAIVLVITIAGVAAMLLLQASK
jgi:serine/threonine-protein kinase